MESFKAKVIKKLNDGRLKSLIQDNNEGAQAFYNVSRETYLAIYNAEIFKDDNKLGYFIPDWAIKNLADEVKKFSDSYDVESGEVLEALESTYLIAATSEERKSKFHVEHTPNSGIGHVGTIYPLDHIKDWSSFASNVLKKIENA